MGIRGVWTFFHRSFKIIDPNALEPLTIGIDMFSLVYTYREILNDLLDIIKKWSDSGHVIICVWDGTAPEEKQQIIEERRLNRNTAKEKKGELEEYLKQHGNELESNDLVKIQCAIDSLSWKSWHLTGSLKKEIQASLGPNITHIFAAGEADDVLIEMIFEKKVNVVLSLDSDIFAMGAPQIWRLMHQKGKWRIEDISVEKVCNEWGITLSILQDASCLAGWDRCHPKGPPSGCEFIPFSKALSLVKFYGKLNIVIEKNPEIAISQNQEALINLKQLKAESKERWLKILNRV
jgi:5'-3' exonuclease